MQRKRRIVIESDEEEEQAEPEVFRIKRNPQNQVESFLDLWYDLRDAHAQVIINMAKIFLEISPSHVEDLDYIIELFMDDDEESFNQASVWDKLSYLHRPSETDDPRDYRPYREAVKELVPSIRHILFAVLAIEWLPDGSIGLVHWLKHSSPVEWEPYYHNQVYGFSKDMYEFFHSESMLTDLKKKITVEYSEVNKKISARWAPKKS